MFNPSRDQVRQAFIDAWRKHCNRLPGTAMEVRMADIVALHPEYHPLLEGADALTREWTPDQGETNPFLHLSLHLAIEEQLGIDQPPGIATAFAGLCARHGERHAALHDVLDCLGEALWRASRDRKPLDGPAYLECIRRKGGA